jgi:hypothetical protein
MSINFSNLQIGIDQLPKTATLEFESLEKSFEWYSVVSTFIMVLLIEVGLISAIYFIAEESQEYLLSMILTALFILLVLAMIAKLSYRYEGYAVRQKDITYKSGIFYRSITTLPFNRIQHMEISQGPVEKLFKLYTLAIFTAGGSGSDVQVHGLSMDKANSIKAYISERSVTKVDEEE